MNLNIKKYKNEYKKWSKDNDIKMYSIHNEEKSVVAEIFIRTLKTKIYKYMTYPRTIKMKPVNVKDNIYIDFKKEVND